MSAFGDGYTARRGQRRDHVVAGHGLLRGEVELGAVAGGKQRGAAKALGQMRQRRHELLRVEREELAQLNGSVVVADAGYGDLHRESPITVASSTQNKTKTIARDKTSSRPKRGLPYHGLTIMPWV